MQNKQLEWSWQWDKFYDGNQWLFTEWIWPNTLEDFQGKDVLDCGCGGGQHLNFIAPYCTSALGVDLNTVENARQHTAHLANVALQEADIMQMNLERTFEIVYSIGVLHHTDDPDWAFRNIAKHCKPGGRVIVWVYSREGNFLNRTVLEWVKRAVFCKLPRRAVWVMSWMLTSLLYVPIYTLYRFPFTFLPFYEYFSNWGKLSYKRNLLNVFDKLNAPQTWFITRAQIRDWFSPEQFSDVHISSYKGVSWRGSGTKKG